MVNNKKAAAAKNIHPFRDWTQINANQSVEGSSAPPPGLSIAIG